MTAKKEESESSIMLRAWEHYSRITGRVVLCVLLSITVLCGPAYLLDRAFGTWPIITGLAMIFSIPLSQVLIIKSMKSYLKDNPIN